MIESDRQVNGLTDIQGRLGFIKVGLLILIALLGLRVWQLQIRDGDQDEEGQKNASRSRADA